jgi:hypothetical protein
MKFECRIGDGDWYEMTNEYESHKQAAQDFAQHMIENEWRKYDLAHAEKMAREIVYAKSEKDQVARMYNIEFTKLRLLVGIGSIA